MEINEVKWRPIGEMPDDLEVPPGCYAITRDTNGDIYGLRLGFRCGFTHFAIVRKPAIKRVLKPCPFPKCKGEIPEFCIYADDVRGYHVYCPTCRAKGPTKPTRNEAKESWGYK